MINVPEYTNSQITALIDEYIHNERDRELMKDRLCDGVYFGPLAEKYGISVQRAKAIYKKYMNILAPHIPPVEVDEK